MPINPPLPIEIVDFWRRAGRAKWYRGGETFDNEIRERFEASHHAAARGEFTTWETHAEGALALLLLLDQFPRNLFRGSAHSYATDGIARRIADRALAAGFDQQIEPGLREFMYLPFEHSEAMADQERSLLLFTVPGGEDASRDARIHADVIRRFGRFPHRNAALSRVSTPAEIEFLQDGGFAG